MLLRFKVIIMPSWNHGMVKKISLSLFYQFTIQKSHGAKKTSSTTSRFEDKFTERQTEKKNVTQNVRDRAQKKSLLR